MQFTYVMALKFCSYAILLSFFRTARCSNFGDLLSDNGMVCDRSLWTKEPSSSRDIGFRIRMDTNTVLYAPEKKYIVHLEAVNSSRFIKFVITVDSLNHSDPGTLQLKDDILSTFSIDCPNTIVQTSSVPVTSISVYWKAPTVDSGCVLIRGAVYDMADNLHHSGNLSLKLCQGELDVLPEILDKCNACNEASYQLIFEGLWSRQTHPKDFPENVFETGFKGIIGVSHTKDFRLFEIKKNASDGIAELAETGETKPLEAELKAQSHQIRTVIKAISLVHPNLNSKTYANFRTDDNNHLVSLIARFTPSPDWVVGLLALELCLPNNSWATSRIINLYPIDVGTVEGITYKVPHVPTMPRAAIRKIGPRENSESPFYSEKGAIQPLAKVTVHRQRVFGKPKCVVNDFSYDNNQCVVTDWTNDGTCNCRTQLQRRRRRFKNESDRYNRNCRVILMDEVPCTCNRYSEGATLNHIPSTNAFTQIPGNSVSCDTTEWNSWSECTCQQPYRSRRRFYRNNMSIQSCSEILWETKDCDEMAACDHTQNVRCAVTEWSEWSPCNATCEMTMGMRLRTRLFFNPTINISYCKVHTTEREPCRSERTDCNRIPEEICFQPKEHGPCTGYFPRWYYDVQEGRCVNFVYSGCRGNKNNFKTYAECIMMCGNVLSEPQNRFTNTLTDDPNLAVDCKLSQWNEWSACSNTCGTSWKERRRTVKINAQNGGQPCENKVYQRSRCKHVPPCKQIKANKNGYISEQIY